jgi:hypothetical protein
MIHSCHKCGQPMDVTDPYNQHVCEPVQRFIMRGEWKHEDVTVVHASSYDALQARVLVLEAALSELVRLSDEIITLPSMDEWKNAWDAGHKALALSLPPMEVKP